MPRIQQYRPASPLLIGGAVLSAGFGFWKGYRVAYVGSAALTAIAITCMLRSSHNRQPIPQRDEQPARPTRKARQSTAAAPTTPSRPPSRRRPSATKAHKAQSGPAVFHPHILTWATQNNIPRQDILEACAGLLNLTDGTVPATRKGWPRLGYAVNKPKLVGYIWNVGVLREQGGIKEGQYTGIRLELKSICRPKGEPRAPATDVMVGIIYSNKKSKKSTTLLKTLVKTLKPSEREHLLLPDEQFVRRDGRAIAMPTAKWDGDLFSTSMTWKEQVDVVLGVARGLEVLHRKGYSHNDLHPGNVVHRNRQIGAIIDWDFLHQNRSRKSGKVGHIYCVPPEAWQRNRRASAGEPTDLWSLGVLMYAVFFGLPRKTGEEWKDTLFLRHRKLLTPSFPVPLQVKNGPAGGAGLGESLHRWNQRLRTLNQKFHRDAFPYSGPVGMNRIINLIEDLMAIDPDRRPRASEAAARLEEIKNELNISKF